jgi:predicted RNA-binding Zn ribbon-like protein
MVTKRPSDLWVIGGNAALDLANTQDGPRGGEPGTDYVRDLADLVEWALHARVIADAPEPADEAETMARFRRLRAAVYAIFWAVASGDEPAPKALDTLTEIHADALARARLVGTGATYDYEPDLLLTPAQAAVDLLRHGPLDRVKACAECRWLFVDTSRNRSRRWCSMNECGGRLKMQRYRARRATGGR